MSELPNILFGKKLNVTNIDVGKKRYKQSLFLPSKNLNNLWHINFILKNQNLQIISGNIYLKI